MEKKINTNFLLESIKLLKSKPDYIFIILLFFIFIVYGFSSGILELIESKTTAGLIVLGVGFLSFIFTSIIGVIIIKTIEKAPLKKVSEKRIEYSKRIISCYRELEGIWQELQDLRLYDDLTYYNKNDYLEILKKSSKAVLIVEEIYMIHKNIVTNFHDYRPKDLWLPEGDLEIWKETLIKEISKKEFIDKEDQEKMESIYNVKRCVDEYWIQILHIFDFFMN